MSSKNPFFTITYKMVKEWITDMETKPNVVKEAITPFIEKIILTQSMKQINHKHLKVKKINPSAINQTKVDHLINQVHWKNQGLLKALKQKTQ